jgi:prepilin-type N-terminal cleavage/methylation domain-containing protein
MPNSRSNYRLGFTLIELLVVISIMVTVSGLGVYGYQQLRLSGERRQAQTFVQKANQAKEAYAMAGGEIPHDATAPNVLAELKKGISTSHERLTTSVGEIMNRDVSLTSVNSSNTKPVVNFIGGVFVYANEGAGFRLSVGDEETSYEEAELSVDGLTFNPNQTGWIWLDGGVATSPSLTSPSIRQLQPPEFVYSGQVPTTSFPLNDILAYPPNPSGTTYHYTIDGTVPTAASPAWDNPEVTITSLPPSFRAIAVHPDPNWLDSDVATTTILAKLILEYSREDGSKSTSFTLGDVAGDTNRVVLSVAGVDTSLFEIYYTGDGTAPTPATDLFSSPFHFDAYMWPKDGRPLKAKALAAAGTMLVDSTTLERDLMPIPTKLPTPEYDIDPTTGAVPSGTLLGISNSLLPYSEIRSDYGDDIPPVTAPYSVTIPIEAP